MAKQAAEKKEVEQQPAPAEQSAGINVQDLVLITQLIQLTTQRGAYRAEELTQVGTLYNKLIAFLESVGAITRPGAEAQQPEEK